MAEPTPEEVARMNRGEMETRNLADVLSVDFGRLMQIALDAPLSASEAASIGFDIGIKFRMENGGAILASRLGRRDIKRLARHRADTVRGWVCYALAHDPARTLEQCLADLRPLADDHHFGVREWVWMAARPRIVADPLGAIRLLEPWVGESSARLRRFATEATRPRGVWCAHIAQLREEPHQALPLLEPLRADPEKYVQDSVANWLNDASKTRPQWVREVCSRWESESPTGETARITRRALRTLRKNGSASG